MSLIKFYRSDRSTAGITDAVFKELEAAAGKPLAERIDLSLPDGETRTPAFLAVNPNGQVPAIVHDGAALWESVAITMYLADLYGVDAGLYPPATNAMERAQASKWIVWSNMSLPAHTHQIFRVLHMKPHPDANVQQVRVKDAEEAKESLAKQLRVLDGELKGGAYLMGEKYSLVDTHVWSIMNYVMMAGVELDQTPNLKVWMDRVGAREQLKGLD